MNVPEGLDVFRSTNRLKFYIKMNILLLRSWRQALLYHYFRNAIRSSWWISHSRCMGMKYQLWNSHSGSTGINKLSWRLNLDWSIVINKSTDGNIILKLYDKMFTWCCTVGNVIFKVKRNPLEQDSWSACRILLLKLWLAENCRNKIGLLLHLGMVKIFPQHKNAFQ